MRVSKHVGVLAFVLFAGACAQPAPPPPVLPKPDLTAEAQAIRAQDAVWMNASKARDAAGEAAVLAPDAIVIRANAPALDPAAFQAFDAKFYADNPKVDTVWTTDTLEINDSGDWAVQTGTYTLTSLGPKGDVMEIGKFTTRWKKINGTWKVVQDTSVSTSPLPVKK